MVLNQKQKRYLFDVMFTKEDLVKIFETANIDYLVKQKITLKPNPKDNHWQDLYWDKELYTSVNFSDYYEGHLDAIKNIENFEKCQWCGEWFERDEMVFRKRGFTKLCDHCNSYLTSTNSL